MRIHIARLVKCVTLLSLWGIVIFPSTPLRAEPDTNKTKQRLSRSLANLARTVDEIKWSNVTIYRVQDEYKQRLIQPQLAAASKDSGQIELHYVDIFIDGTEAPNLYQTAMRIVASPRNQKPEVFRQKVADAYGKAPEDVDDQVAEQVLNLAVKIMNFRKNIPKDYFLITNRDQQQPMLMALIGIEDLPGGGFVVKGSPTAGIDLFDNLKSSDATLYEDLREGIISQTPSLKNQMFLLRDLSEIVLAPQTMGRTKYLDEEKYGHILLSVSQGRPLRQADSNRILAANLPSDPTLPERGGAAIPNGFETQYVVSVGTDVIASFVAYKTTPDTLPIPEPDWGVELRGGFDEINYPSIWGGRTTLNAILENIKIGAVLPHLRFGDSTIGTSGFGDNHQKIIGGYGLAVSGDFTAPLLANSGLFNFFATYSFGEANANAIQLFDSTSTFNESGYVIRYAAQLYYSFGFYADDAARHLFRLKIGGTAYGVDYYTRHYDADAVVTGTEERPTILVKDHSESVGGISGKIEYMKTGQYIPWGAGLQYFDQSILSDIWIQFAVTPSLDLKFAGKYFAVLNPKSRLETHPWENTSLVVPSVSVKYHF